MPNLTEPIGWTMLSMEVEVCNVISDNLVELIFSLDSHFMKDGICITPIQENHTIEMSTTTATGSVVKVDKTVPFRHTAIVRRINGEWASIKKGEMIKIKDTETLFYAEG